MKKKINSESVKQIRNHADTGLELCRKSLVKSIIGLCRETGLDSGKPIRFTKTLILMTTKPRFNRKNFVGYETETTICNQLLWSEDACYFMVEMDSATVSSSKSDFFLTIDNLTIIYNEMLEVLKKLDSVKPIQKVQDEGMSKNKLDEMVDILCYNQWEHMTRREGLKKYREGMQCSEGSEHERYEKIFFDLLEGKMIASDN